MEELKKLVIKKSEEDFKKDLDLIKTEEGFNKVLGWNGKEYKGTIEEQKQKLIKYLTKKKEESLKQELNKLDVVNKVKAFTGEFIITLEWKKSRMWGSNPRAYTNYGFEGESIGGCGYCKTSTATAQALNSNLSILKLMYLKKNNTLKNPKKQYVGVNGDKGTRQSQINQEVLGYGAGYNIIPTFEGGVGVSSHEQILRGLGLYMRCISDTSQTNVYLIRKMTKKELARFKEQGY